MGQRCWPGEHQRGGAVPWINQGLLLEVTTRVPGPWGSLFVEAVATRCGQPVQGRGQERRRAEGAQQQCTAQMVGRVRHGQVAGSVFQFCIKVATFVLCFASAHLWALDMLCTVASCGACRCGVVKGGGGEALPDWPPPCSSLLWVTSCSQLGTLVYVAMVEESRRGGQGRWQGELAG